MAQQELDLLKFPAGFMTETGACATHVMGSHIFKAALRTSSFHNTPDGLGAEGGFSDPLGLVDGPKYRSGGDVGGTEPAVHCGLDPCRDWDGPHLATLAHKVGDDPVLVSLLQIFDGERGCLGPSEPASEKHGDHGIVALAPQVPKLKYGQEPSALFGGQPIANPHSTFFNALYSSDPCCKVGAQEAAIRSLVCKSANSRETQIDCGGCVLVLFEADPVSCDNGFVES